MKPLRSVFVYLPQSSNLEDLNLLKGVGLLSSMNFWINDSLLNRQTFSEFIPTCSSFHFDELCGDITDVLDLIEMHAFRHDDVNIQYSFSFFGIKKMLPNVEADLIRHLISREYDVHHNPQRIIAKCMSETIEGKDTRAPG